jgi:hypothetical protein
MLFEMENFLNESHAFKFTTVENFFYGISQIRFFPKQKYIPLNVLDILEDINDEKSNQIKRITPYLKNRIHMAVSLDNCTFSEIDCFKSIIDGFFFASPQFTSPKLQNKELQQIAVRKPVKSVVSGNKLLCQDICDMLESSSRDSLVYSPKIIDAGVKSGGVANAEGLMELFEMKTYYITV